MKMPGSASYRVIIVSLLSVLIVSAMNASVLAEKLTLNGGGASFPAPLYIKWFKDYHQTHPNVRINYQAIGSGGGVANFFEKRFDFAGSDVLLNKELASQVDSGVVQVPLTGGAVVLIYNLEGIKNLRLSREAYAGIFLGKVKHWQDPLIAKTNKGVDLPDQEINVVARSDSSGTTHILTQHLSAVNDMFAKMVGTSTKPIWPADMSRDGRLIKTLGNGSVAQMVKVIPGSIGYVEYSYAYFTDITMAALQNKSGQFVSPAPASFFATIESITPPPEALVTDIADPIGQNSYPILSLTWFLCHRTYDNPLKLKTIKDILSYCLTEGQKYNEKLGYVPLTEAWLAKARALVDGLEVK
jgi:phosphate transport system substrate-binding protein